MSESLITVLNEWNSLYKEVESIDDHKEEWADSWSDRWGDHGWGDCGRGDSGTSW